MTTLAYSTQSSLKNLWRNRYSSIGTILLIAIILFILNVILSVNMIVKSQLNELGEKVTMIVYLQDNISQDKAKEINEDIRSQSGVKDSVYISKQQALANFLKSHPKTAEYYQKFNLENTLPPSIQVTVASPSMYETVQSFLQASANRIFINTLEEPDAQGNSADTSITQKVTENLFKLDRFSRTLLFWVIAAFLIGSVLIMNNGIHLAIYNRRVEISIMRLVGATPNLICLPYLLEAVWSTLIAVILSFSGFYLMTKFALLPEINFFSDTIVLPFIWLLLAEVGATLALTLISSFAAVEKHLQKHMVLS
ncbi:MAG: permease-like cell division protein FtsX [Candidatus Peregrinibacteria bacterium]|nr:permease-like cell division protein FtsX [Candidatus Peregrinibacteria bacterium]